MKCTTNNLKSYTDLWCNYRDLSYLEEIREQGVKLAEKELRLSLDKADKLSKLGRKGGCYYEDNLNIHYYLELLTIFRKDLDDYIFNCGCLTQDILDSFIDKYQVKCPINACNVDSSIFRKIYQLFIPKYGYCDDTLCLDWGVETECLCELDVPTEPVITITDVQNTTVNFAVEHTGTVLELNIINAETDMVLNTFSTTESEFTLSDLSLSTLYTIRATSFNCAGQSSNNVQVQTTPISVTVIVDNLFPVSAGSPQQGTTIVSYNSNFSVTGSVDNTSQPLFENSNTAYILTKVNIENLSVVTRDLFATEFSNGLPTGGSILINNIKFDTTVTLKVGKYLSSWEEETYSCVLLNTFNTGEIRYNRLTTSYYGESMTLNIPANLDSTQLNSYLISNNILSSVDITTVLLTQRIEENRSLCPVPNPISEVSIVANNSEPESFLTFDLSQSTDGNLMIIGQSDQVTHTISLYDNSNNLVFTGNYIPTISKSVSNGQWYPNLAQIALNTDFYLPNSGGYLIHTVTYNLQSGSSNTSVTRYPVSISFTGNIASTVTAGTYWVNENSNFNVTFTSNPDPITSITVNNIPATITDPNLMLVSITINQFTTITAEG